MLTGILLNDWFIGDYRITDRKNLGIIFIAGKHHSGETHHDKDNHQNHGNATASGEERNQFLHGIRDGFDGFCCVVSCFLS